MHILIAEDDRDIAELMALYARKAGWTPHIFGSGDEALAHARTGPVDVAVLDIMLPGTSGLDVCRAELEFAVTHEGALDADDILDRRTRIGLVPADRAAAHDAALSVLAEHGLA